MKLVTESKNDLQKTHVRRSRISTTSDIFTSTGPGAGGYQLQIISEDTIHMEN